MERRGSTQETRYRWWFRKRTDQMLEGKEREQRTGEGWMPPPLSSMRTDRKIPHHFEHRDADTIITVSHPSPHHSAAPLTQPCRLPQLSSLSAFPFPRPTLACAVSKSLRIRNAGAAPATAPHRAPLLYRSDAKHNAASRLCVLQLVSAPLSAFIPFCCASRATAGRLRQCAHASGLAGASQAQRKICKSDTQGCRDMSVRIG